MEALLSANRIALPCATPKRAASVRQPHSRIVRVQASRYAQTQACLWLQSASRSPCSAATCCSHRCTNKPPQRGQEPVDTTIGAQVCAIETRGLCAAAIMHQNRVDFASHDQSAIWAGQGPPPPNPMVVERFQQVITQLFQQVCRLLLSWMQDLYSNPCSASYVLVALWTMTWPT